MTASPLIRMRIGDRNVGPGEPCFVIAEAGVNHNGDLDLARALLDAAADAGADAVKFQTFRADRVATATAPKAAYQRETTGASDSQRDMLARLELDANAHRALVAHCRDRDIAFLSSPFDLASVDLLVELGVPALKLGSGELTNRLLVDRAAGTGLPLLLSTGMATLDEVTAALEWARTRGATDVAVLHCVSEYPAPVDQLNLRAIATLADACACPVGYSDHAAGTSAALAAVALGACIIEKHLTVDRALPGPDHRASCEPDELAALVRGVRDVEAALGDGIKRPAPCEADNRQQVRRSLATARAVSAGHALGPADLTALRPGTGIAPAHADRLVGRRARRDLPPNAILSWDDLVADTGDDAP